MGAPHVLSAHAGSVGGIAESSRQSFAESGPRRPTAGDGGVLRGWDTTASTRRLVAPVARYRITAYRRAGVWTGCLVGREHASAPAGRRCGPLVAMTPATIPRYRRRAVCADKVCGAPIFSSATSVDRGDRPSETPGPSGGEQQPRPSGGEQQRLTGRWRGLGTGLRRGRRRKLAQHREYRVRHRRGRSRTPLPPAAQCTSRRRRRPRCRRRAGRAGRAPAPPSHAASGVRAATRAQASRCRRRSRRSAA